MTRIKICGLTRPEDVIAAAEMGAHMLGFIQVPKTPRHLEPEQLAGLISVARRYPVEVVLVVRNAPESQLRFLKERMQPDAFQFHGDEAESLVRRFGGYRTFHMAGDADRPAVPQTFGDRFLLDTSIKGLRGGSGKTFDWSVLPQVQGQFLVAGGLTPENVGDLVRTYQPWGVDVSSGVEAQPRVKDHQRLQRFIESVRRANSHDLS